MVQKRRQSYPTLIDKLKPGNQSILNRSFEYQWNSWILPSAVLRLEIQQQDFQRYHIVLKTIFLKKMIKKHLKYDRDVVGKGNYDQIQNYYLFIKCKSVYKSFEPPSSISLALNRKCIIGDEGVLCGPLQYNHLN